MYQIDTERKKTNKHTNKQTNKTIEEDECLNDFSSSIRNIYNI